MSEKKEKPRALNVTNTKLAACLHTLGFYDWKVTCIQPEDGGHMKVSFMFLGGSARPEFAGRIFLGHARALLTGQLEKLQPMHPLCVMMRGQNNHDLLAWAAAGVGRSISLAGVAGGQMTTYVRGPLDPAFTAPGVETVPVDDHDLVAGLGGVGLPVVRIEGEHPFNRYHVARTGYALQGASEDAPLKIEDAAALICRAPTKQDERRLALEVSEPTHPVCLIYDSLAVRARFKADLGNVTPLLLMGGGQKLKALVSMNATGRIMEKATSHVKSPPLVWR